MNYNFNVEIATKIGVDESIMLNNFVYWLAKNKANNKNFFDGNFWTFNSVRAYCELFPFWKESQIKRILKSLIYQNVLVVGNYNQNAYDRTNWYSLSNEYIHLIDWTISTNGKAENSQPIPINKTINKTKNISIDIVSSFFDENRDIKKDDKSIKIMSDFVTYRKQIKKPIKTTGNLKLYYNKLKELHLQGYDIAKCIEEMKLREWKIVEVKFVKDRDDLKVSKSNDGIYGGHSAY
ncbi:MAG: hypothetical protein WC141_09130 [Arcobacteraceae bacterium]